MADRRYNVPGQGQSKKHVQVQPKATIISNSNGGRPLRRRLRRSYYSSELATTQLMGIMALLVSTGILLILSGVTITTTLVSLIFFAPIIIITSPIWVPIAILVFFTVAGVLSLCGLGLAAAAVLYWLSAL